MNFTLLVVDGILLLTFVVGRAEAALNSSYRLTLWRFARAASVPVLVSAFLHLMTALNWWLPVTLPFAGLFRPNLNWLAKAVVTGISGLCMMALLFLVLDLMVLKT